jgi:hypothetical protein
MARYIVTVEYQDGQYWIRFPGIEKAGSHAKRPEDIVPHAQSFLTDWVRYGSPPPFSLGEATTAIREPFEGTRLIVFDWEPPSRTGYRIFGYQLDELVSEMIVPVEHIARARELAQVPDTEPNVLAPYPLTWEVVREIVGLSGVWGGCTYFLAPDFMIEFELLQDAGVLIIAPRKPSQLRIFARSHAPSIPTSAKMGSSLDC